MMDNSGTLPPAPDPTNPPLKSFGDYEIEREIGRGGMGVVYLARQTELNRPVALKMLTGHYGPDELHRFREEAETAAGLNHTNIAHIYEVGEHDGAPFFSMEYVEGGTLADRLRKELPSPQETASLLIQVARALHFAHQNGVVHRDMKPANVVLTPDGVPKVTDFGIAKRLKEDTKLTRTGAVIGTPTYMAPEQAKGSSRHVGPAADIYSLGAILYEMLTGRPPFLPEDSETAITVRVLTEDPVSPAWHRPDIPRDLETICMKCLAKEPRARYASAAALAEDLRRFLDDESILAKPPSTVSHSIKWIRRHPWAFISSVAAVLVVASLLAGLAWWMLYIRPQLEYAKQVVWVNGRLESAGSISQAEASGLDAYLRLTRRGRSGPITKVEVLNARGRPAVLRRILHDEMIPIYIEGLAGAQPYTERLPETTAVEFLLDEDGKAREATGRDRNGRTWWRIIYDPRFSGRNARASFVNLRGFSQSSLRTLEASHIELERDDKGRDTKISFFNAVGKPTINGEGVYGYELAYDDAGRITRLVNLGQDGQPAANRAGLIAYTVSWGKEVRVEVRDAQGQPAVWNGVAAIVNEYDNAGNPLRRSMLGADGKPWQSAQAEWAVQEMKRNERGELIERASFKPDSSGALKQVGLTVLAYDDFGHPADIRFRGETSSWRTALRFDERGNITEEKRLDDKGNPITGDEGYAIKRLTYTFGAQGSRVEEAYFGASGEKAYAKDGHHRLINEWDTTGNLRRQIYEEYDQSRFKYYRFVSEPEYTTGRLSRMVTRFEDEQGRLVTDNGYLFAATEALYDENGRITAEWMTVSKPEDFGGPILRFDREWQSNGKMKREVQQVCDANRQPLPFISTGSPSRKETEFDVNERPERIYETGFDEKLVGFSTREAKFSGGALQSVVHTRGDGTTLKSVRVIINYVTPPPEQPKSSDLKVGDQIIAINGKPVTSAYAILSAGSFPGGWIEVLRQGQRLRINGFVPGKLGIALEERAPLEN
ncbi:MAG TPA: protein kinase [Pyrinomonadaceae bacterium]|jgi:serine/threonine protein kinase